MIATAQLVSLTSTDVASGDAEAAVVTHSDVLLRHHAARERELDAVAAGIEDAAAGLGVFLLLAMVGLAFLVATLSGALA